MLQCVNIIKRLVSQMGSLRRICMLVLGLWDIGCQQTLSVFTEEAANINLDGTSNTIKEMKNPQSFDPHFMHLSSMSRAYPECNDHATCAQYQSILTQAMQDRNILCFPETYCVFQKHIAFPRNILRFPETYCVFRKKYCVSRNILRFQAH